MAEGGFPKVDGDILYASEANRFGGAGRFFAAGSTPYGVSGTTRMFGSYVIPAGSLSLITRLRVEFLMDGNADIGPQFAVSGLSNNNFWQSGTSQTVPGGTADFLLGSPLKGGCHYQLWSYNSPNAVTIDRVENIANFNTTQAAVVFFGGIMSAAGASGLAYYMITEQGRGY